MWFRGGSYGISKLWIEDRIFILCIGIGRISIVWICESGSQIETAGLDLGTIKNDVNMLLESSYVIVNGIKFTFQKKMLL